MMAADQLMNAALLGTHAGLTGGMYTLEEHLWTEEDGDTPINLSEFQTSEELEQEEIALPLSA